MDLSDYRNSTSERTRISDLMHLIPSDGDTVLDIGARDGFISLLLSNHFSSVTALDLSEPIIEHDRIHCVKGNITKLDFPNSSFDLVFCAEVLEHIPTHLLQTACIELARVSRRYLLIGVPYKQDIRVGRTTCANCGKVNPPWGHVNTFDEKSLAELFPGLSVVEKSFVGVTNEHTNAFSSALMNLAGNPYGTYSQEESCIHCNKNLGGPIKRNIWQKALTKTAFIAMRMQKLFIKQHPNWIHLLMQKK